MLDSYFFIPGDKINFLKKIEDLQSDFYVLDLEDSVSKKNKQLAFNNLFQLKVNDTTYVRIPFLDGSYTLNQRNELINHFEGRVVVPKIRNERDFTEIIEQHDIKFSLKSIVLVETPNCFIHLKDILSTHYKNIEGIGFGSHDFCSVMGTKHELKNLIHYKKDLILLAKAFGKSYIDSVDLNLKDFSDFHNECLFAFENGATGKFLIHPLQLKEIKKVEYLSEKEKQKIIRVYHQIKSLNFDEIDIIQIEGEIYEMPHVLKIMNLYNRLIK